MNPIQLCLITAILGKFTFLSFSYKIIQRKNGHTRTEQNRTMFFENWSVLISVLLK